MARSLVSVFARLRSWRVHVYVLYVLVLAASIVRAREACVHSPLDQLFSDPGRHWAHAKEPLGTAPWILIDAPIFQMWLSIVQKWSLGVPLLVGVYQGAMSVLTPWFWYRFLLVYLEEGDAGARRMGTVRVAAILDIHFFVFS